MTSRDHLLRSFYEKAKEEDANDVDFRQQAKSEGETRGSRISLKNVTKAVGAAVHIMRRFKMKNHAGEETQTKCFGDIIFSETTRFSSSKFIRISDETNPKELYDFMVDTNPVYGGWGLEKPRLLITVAGGANPFPVDSRLKKNFEEGLAKVASTPGAWVITGGTSTGVSRMVGDANHGMNNIFIGIAAWGFVANKETFDSDDLTRRYEYSLDSYLVKKGCAFLDSNHSHFILVDDGSDKEFGREIAFRQLIEKHINANVPTVVIVVEGDAATLDSVYNTSVKCHIPCVIIKESGKAADLLVYALKWQTEIESREREKGRHEGLIKEIRKLTKDVDKYYNILLECLKVSEIFTVAEYDGVVDTDDAILTALLQDRKQSPSHYEQLRLTILWNRADLAESVVLSPLLEWKNEGNSNAEKEFNRLMIMALAMNRPSFVRLLLDYGISLKRALTKEVLEFLYYCYDSFLTKANVRAEPMATSKVNKAFFEDLLNYDAVGEGRSERKGSKRSKLFKFPLKRIRRHLQYILARVPTSHVENLIEIPENDADTFNDPFRQLFIWAVLNNLLEMALYFWQFLDDSIATMLIGCEITCSMMDDPSFKDNSQEGDGSLQNQFETFKRLSIDVMGMCHKENVEDTEIIVTSRIKLFNDKSSCLEFAAATEQEEFVAQPAIQGLLDKVWYGSIKATDASLKRIIATMFCPLLLLKMDIRSTEEIDEMNNSSHRSLKHQLEDAEDQKKKDMEIVSQLAFHKKFYNFHVHSPIVRFCGHTFGYLLFLMLLSYVAMKEKNTSMPHWTEMLVMGTVFGYLVAEIYQFLHVDTDSSFLTRLQAYVCDVWNMFDWLCIAIFIVAVVLRFNEQTLFMSHLFYGVDVSLWIVRCIQILHVDEVTGPYVVTIGQMLSNMFKFLLILLIFLMSYGVGVKAFMDPASTDNINMFIQTFYLPYAYIHGGYFFHEGTNETTILGTPAQAAWQEPMWLIYVGVYLFIIKICLLNILIALFGNIYTRIMTNSKRCWKFHR